MNEHGRPVLFHVAWEKNHIQRPGFKKAFMRKPSHSGWCHPVGLKDHDRLLKRSSLPLSYEDAQEIGLSARFRLPTP